MEQDSISAAGERPRSNVRYPYYSLPRSVEFASEIRKAGGTEAAEEDVLSGLGLSAKTTRRWTYGLSSAEEFGLVVRAGRGKQARLRLTDLAKQLLLPGGTNEEQVARVAALSKPAIYQNLLRRFSGAPIPKREGLANILVRDFGLLESVAEAAADGFLESVNYAGIQKGGIVTPDVSAHPLQDDRLAREPEDDETASTQAVSVPAAFLVHQFLLRRDLKVVIPLPPDLSHRDVQRLTRWLATLPLENAPEDDAE